MATVPDKLIYCAVCGKLFTTGRFLIDAWGNPFCDVHQHEYSYCSVCQRLICPGLTGGGVTYQDGRLVCNLCRQTAVDTKEQAKPIVEGLAGWLYQCGLRFQGLSLKIDVQDANIIRRNYKQLLKPISDGQLLGYISRSVEYRDGKKRRLVKGVTILSGLPRESFEGTVVHELGHAWLYLAHVDNLELWQEEGFCNLLCYILHKNRHTPEAQFQVRLLEIDSNPVYGEGFRRVRTLFKKHGFGEAINYVFYNRCFPPE